MSGTHMDWDAFVANNERMLTKGDCLTGGIWPYLLGVKLRLGGYRELLANGYSVRREGEDFLIVRPTRRSKRWSMVGMHRYLRQKLDADPKMRFKAKATKRVLRGTEA